MFQIKKQDIFELNLEAIVKLNTTELEAWATENKLSRFESWLPQQLVAWFGSWTLARDGNRWDILSTLKQNVGTDPKLQALWKLTRLKRSLLVNSQVKTPEYATLTPLLLMGFRRMQGVAYESWRDLPNLELILEPKLYEAVVLDDYSCCDLGSEELLQIRDEGLTTKSGNAVGTKKSPETTWSLTGVQGTAVGGLPKLTQTMLTQIWLAHPKHRTPYMILDPQDWDRMPDPLITNEIFKVPSTKPLTPPKKERQPEVEKLPWM